MEAVSQAVKFCWQKIKKLPKAVKPRKVYLFKMSVVAIVVSTTKSADRYQPEYTDCIRIGYLPSSGEPQCFKACYRGPCAAAPFITMTILGSMCLAAVTSSPLIPSILSSSITGEVYSIIKLL
jgi:hypothetical protein